MAEYNTEPWGVAYNTRERPMVQVSFAVDRLPPAHRIKLARDIMSGAGRTLSGAARAQYYECLTTVLQHLDEELMRWPGFDYTKIPPQRFHVEPAGEGDWNLVWKGAICAKIWNGGLGEQFPTAPADNTHFVGYDGVGTGSCYTLMTSYNPFSGETVYKPSVFISMLCRENYTSDANRKLPQFLPFQGHCPETLLGG